MTSVASPVVQIQRESFDALWADADALLERHWREIAAYDDIELAVDVDRYREMERADSLRILTARADDVLIGYAVFVVHTHGHYRHSKQALQDVFYVHPDHRGVRIGLKLIDASEAMLKAEGVQVVYQHVKCAHPELGRLLEHRGYTRSEWIYGKRLDRG